jgi:thymidine kinase
MEYIKKGFISVTAGCMFSGKTEELLRRKRRSVIAKKKVLLFKPDKDNRYSETQIVTHNSLADTSIVVNSSKELYKHASKLIGADIFIDEAQFFDMGLVDVCMKLADQGCHVYLAGLQTDFKNEPFDVMKELMIRAEYVDMIHAICIDCGSLASHSHRKHGGDKKIETGGSEKYEALCRDCFNKKRPK